MLHSSSSTPPQCPGHRSCGAAWAAGWELVGPGGAGLTYAATAHTISCEFAAEQDRGHLLASLWANIISTLNIFKCTARNSFYGQNIAIFSLNTCFKSCVFTVIRDILLTKTHFSVD